MSILGYMQKVGKALMVPVATLPAAAILMGIGYWIDPVGWGSESIIAAFLIKSGGAIIGKTGMYQAGFFPIMMFGLPGAALAMYHCAEARNKDKVFSIMIAAAMASFFFTGITEPLEFSFMFLAPVLYFVHAVLTGISLYIAASMQWMAGFGFSAGFVDFVLSSQNPLATKWYMLIAQGVVFFTIYYFLFRFIIQKFNLNTPGRGEDMNEEQGEADMPKLAQAYINEIGGDTNIIEVDNCITRLRLTVKDSSLADHNALKALGAVAVVPMGKEGLQVIIGLGKVDKVADAMKTILKK